MNIDGSQMRRRCVSNLDTMHIWRVQLVKPG